MILRMFSRFFFISALILLSAVSSFAQDSSVSIEPNMRLFTTMAALNAAGFDVEYGSQYHPVREMVRKFTEGLDPDLIARLKAFYSSRKGIQTDDEQLAKYISLAVNLSDPPEFKPASREEFMPPDARTIMGFAELLREFYEKVRISQRWVEVRPQYEQGIAKVAPVLRDMIVRTDAYLRVPLGRVASRSMAIYLELAAPINTVNVRSNQDNYYVVLGDSTNLRLDDIRHAYLHFQLDNLVATSTGKVSNPGALLALISKAQGVDPAYTSEFHVMAAESLIRAIELRIDRAPAVRARESVDTFYRTGLLLTPYFYTALGSYEQSDSSIREYFADMLKGLQLKTEQQRFQETFYKIPVPEKTVSRPEVPQAPPAPPPNPTRDLLKEAESAFAAGNDEKAREAFERVLSDFDRDNGSAFFGLALIASRRLDGEEAIRYFERAIRSESAEPYMKVWSYIYLGRIFDQQCNRDRAVQYYQQATKVGDDTRNAQAAAREGLQKPYGEACR
jgi:tetratricopeptide (TPR) repeat protein